MYQENFQNNETFIYSIIPMEVLELLFFESFRNKKIYRETYICASV